MAVIAPIGSVVLGGIRFTSDPETYQPLTWPKRISSFKGIGSVTHQDFGHTIKDLTLHLESGEKGRLDQATVAALLTKFTTRGVTWPYADSLGNSFDVLMLAFDPQLEPGLLYAYTMTLAVLSATTILGAPYTGA